MIGSATSRLLVAAVALAAVAGACRSAKTPARFPHAVHLAELECDSPGKPCLSCNSCHTVSARDRAHKLPEGDLCTECHRDQEVLAVLHAKPERISGPIHFDHDRHLALDAFRGQCVPCHAGIVSTAEPNIPAMSECFSCHVHQAEWDRGECSPCHEPAALARTLPRSFLPHDESFARHHGTAAALEGQLCTACHTESDCQGCHDTSGGLAIERRRPDEVDRRFVHRADFVVRHAIEAESQPARCLRCHETSTCDGCHVARGVSANRVNASNPHPPEWVGSNTQSSDFHGRAARRDIASCAACHDRGPATNCIRCHAVGGFGGNPHPKGWRSAQGTGAEMCRYCHGS